MNYIRIYKISDLASVITASIYIAGDTSLIDAETILRNISLRVGNKTYINSPTLLPNTIVDQQPAENNLVNLGDSVNVVLTQTKFGDKR